MKAFVRLAGRFVAVVAVLLTLLILLGRFVTPDTRGEVVQRSPEEIARIETARDVTRGFDDPPTTHKQVDYGAGPSAAWWPKGESPVLADLVAEGKIEPVAERVGPEPAVLESCDGIGRYGGTWHRLVSAEYDVTTMEWRMAGATLARWSPLGEPIVPHVAKGWEQRDGGREWIIYLRKGMRWSDGHPFTAHDILYWWETQALLYNDVPTFLQVGGEPAEITAIDDHTLRFRFAAPNGVFLIGLAQQHEYAFPKHYLASVHPKFGDQEKIARLCAERGFAGGPSLYNHLRSWMNPECPRLWPWILRTYSPQAPYHFVRNPYYFAVDTQGNQLPYVDRVMLSMKQNKMIPVAMAAGEVSMQLRHIGFNNYTLLMANRDAGDYDVYHWYSATRSPAVVFANTNRAYQSVETAEVEMDDPAAAEAAAGRTLHLGVVAEDKRILARRGDEVRAADLANWRAEGIEKVTVVTAVREDSVAKMKRELLKDARFRQALSLSMDREEIIKAEFLDRKRMGDSVLSEQIIPAQLAPGRESRFHSEKLMTAFSEFDLPRANALLDEIGLTRRDTEGMRTLPDGSPLTIYLYTTSDYFANVGITELMIEQWRRAGLRVVLRDRARPLFNAERATLVHDLSLWTGESEFNPLSTVRSFVPTELYSWQAPGYGVWYERGGAWDNPAAQLAPGAVAPPEDSPLREAQRLFTQVQQTVDPAEQARLVQKILDEYNAPYCWGISVCTPPPQPVVVARGLRGVPGNALVGAALATPANAGPETFWFEKDTNSPDARARISRSMIEIRMDGASAAGEAGGVEVLAAGGGWLGRLVMWLLIGSLLLMLALAAFRHPFVLRRLAIMLPTLLVVSVVAFVIIQLPPSDFLETRIADLRMQGDEASARTVEDLKRVFHTEESQLSRYLRWTGLTWFTTFDSDDRGLLQGDLGRSMEDSRPVMEVVSDRIILTVAVSAATIVFTWVTALTIGIFSAVRQYSLLDYVFTSVGFVGMSVPNFLLALLLMHWGNVWFGVTVTGLFSPDYADEPWSRAKLIDLARHIWLPVVVLGVAGTAGMIRVMRANLLDELRKPYVTTARARGVRPIRLLLKYPVRIALNPFISGIGHLFPALVSGGAIVSMVLSLPMVGPKMIYALQNEDMYLAGSLLMVLSLLGICGTLVSDLLLLWLDPRVRMEGGGER